ncbi:hypothetical protein NDU88_009835 [Pleurodeles waltl]|uniref:Uncharacterized protein n=1 Tax=Pleurodeles waltl TaxID=8319 RepID=A0AAV7QVN5_PLEWA|nr:hypothetical protein NDU88_009835 [Pleurodeles waltl]
MYDQLEWSEEVEKDLEEIEGPHTRMSQASFISDQSSAAKATNALLYDEASNDLHLMVTKKNSQQSTNGATSSGQDLKWDCTASPLLGGNAAGNKEDGLSHLDTATLETIDQSIMAHLKETRVDSRRAQIASQKLQGEICKLIKTCTEFSEKMTEVNNRAAVVESEVMDKRKCVRQPRLM